MDYQKIYNQIIERAQNRKLEDYKEKHHIIPKCLGGSNEEENIVELTAREHFLCHMLLCEIYPKEHKLKHALFLMAIGKQKIKENIYIIGSRVYERLKQEYSQMLTGKKHSKETCIKKSNKMKEIWSSKSYEEKQLISSKRQKTKLKNGTNKISKTTAENISKSLQGRKITWDRGVNKKILQFDLEGNFIKEWNSIAEASRSVKGDVGSHLIGRQKTAGGYIWKYKEN
jgi:hypothetical protein